MNPTISSFSAELSLPLSPEQTDRLEAYAGLVWQKKDQLNLTSAADLEEIYARHICDGLRAAAFIYAQSGGKDLELGDAGSGAGYIGLACAAALPQCRVTLVESLQRRCAFLNWAVMTLGLKNVKVANRRLGENTSFAFDFLTERAMGKLPDILPVCAGAVRAGGTFIAFQGEHPDEASPALLKKCRVIAKSSVPYILPHEKKTRFLAVFEKEPA